jgi:hypothetical protein
MPIKLSTPLIETFELEKTDLRYGNEEGTPTTVTIKQATQAQHEQRQQIFATLERRFDDFNPEVTTLVQKANTEELKRTEAYLTLVDCNITKSDGKSPLFISKKGKDGLPELDMTKSEFDIAWGLLPPDVANEIHEKVVELNIMWGPRG